MSSERVKEHLKKWNRENDIIFSRASTATVQLAAEAVGVIPARIAKTLAFVSKECVTVIVAAGDARIDNKKFKACFGVKPKMLSAEDTFKFTGYNVGGVCPFGLPEGVAVYLDESLKRFETVFPACGTDNSAIELTLKELEEYSGSKKWVDVCTKWQENRTEVQ